MYIPRMQIEGDIVMHGQIVTRPELALIAGSRAVLGAGLGLLLADRLDHQQRKSVGWSLFLVGVLSTIPLAMEVLGKSHSAPADSERRAQLGRAAREPLGRH